MISFEKFVLPNGLRVILHEDLATPLVAINVLYDVGSKDEDPNKTGFAHLFEHLMFGGSVNIPKYDEPLQNVGGQNNAFTNTDITNYYLTLPKENIETGLWLESDRMLGLAFSEKSLNTQRKVVIEEFKQSYLNQPYGDVWLELRKLAFRKHPYRWATIGKTPSHIRNAEMEDVKAFFKKHYNPSNAILSISGNISIKETYKLVEKWFGGISAGEKYNRILDEEPEQISARAKAITKPVPYDAIYIAYHSPSRLDKDYYASDLISDVLSNGYSSRLYQSLVKEKKMFSEINAYITGEIELGVFVISGKIAEGVVIEKAEEEIERQLSLLKTKSISKEELSKVKNKIEANHTLNEMNVLNKAMSLAYYELLGDANKINQQVEMYRKVSQKDIKRVAQEIFKQEKANTLYYLSTKE